MPEQGNAREAARPQTGPSPSNVVASATADKIVANNVVKSRIVPAGSKVPSQTRRGTGPRTKLGKGRSKRNALKHGIFSQVVLCKDEPRSEFDVLLRGLQKDLRPEGALETHLVEKLAVALWRHRRLVIAETAEIQRGIESVAWEENHRQVELARDTSEFSPYCVYGVMERIDNPKVLERCVFLLQVLVVRIMDHGFEPEFDSKILTQLYGEESFKKWQRTLFDSYRFYLEDSKLSEAERQRDECPTPKECERDFLEEVREEIDRLKNYRKMHAAMESKKMKLEVLRRNLPETPQLDRLLRYEASLERSFDRTLSQLERLQRTRLGQAVLPRIEVTHSLT